MHELDLPGSLVVLRPGEPSDLAAPRLHHGLLFLVMLGHVLVVWLVRSAWVVTPPATVPKVLSVTWIADQVRVAPNVAIAPLNAMPDRHPTVHSSPQPPSPAGRVVDPALVQVVKASSPADGAPVQAAAPGQAPVSVAAVGSSALDPPANHAIPGAEPAQPVPGPLRATPAISTAETSPNASEAVLPPSYHADYLANPAPIYPPLSRRLGEEGVVHLRVRVSAEGLPQEVRLDAGSGFPRLDQAAREAVAGWRFVPARQGEKPVVGWVRVPMTFNLRRDS